MAGFCFLRTAIFAHKSRQILSIVGLSIFFFFVSFPEFICCLFIAAAIFVFLCGFSWLLQNPEIDHLEENPKARGDEFEDPDGFGEDERLKEFLVVDNRKEEVISGSINGGNQALQYQRRSHPQESDQLEEYPCERGERYEDPGDFFCEFGEVERSEEVLVADHWKKELVSSSNNGGNQTQYQFHPPIEALWSMKKEKVWSRTLACKLRESGGEPGGAGEEMDLLWEAYEKTEENRGGQRENSGEKKKSKRSKKNRIVDYLEDFDDDEGGNPQICCLKALKLSAGKMNFGMSKSGLLKISKSIRGIETGWLSRKKKRF